MAQSKYKYDPLKPKRTVIYSDLGSEETGEGDPPIRLLNLYPGQHNDTLLGDLVVREKQEYEALSYSWGRKTERPPVIGIMQNGKSRPLSITENLASALRHLRHSEDSRYLWVDAICINQADKHEKSHQIPMMGRIYSEATNVCIWLGEKATTSMAALEHIRRVLDLKGFDRLVSRTHTADWAALSEMMRREWFNRRWVVQEIAFARQATVHCGAEWIYWSELADAVALFGSRAEEIANLFRGDDAYKHQVDFLGDVEALGANRLVQTISKLFRKSDDGQKLEAQLSLEALVSNLSDFNASKPHDIIYAVLSLANDTITSAKETESQRSQATVPTIETHHAANDTASTQYAGGTSRSNLFKGDPGAGASSQLARRPSKHWQASLPMSPGAVRRLSVSDAPRLSLNPGNIDSALTNAAASAPPSAPPSPRGLQNSLPDKMPIGEEEAIKFIMEEIVDEEKKSKVFTNEAEVRDAMQRVKAEQLRYIGGEGRDGALEPLKEFWSEDVLRDSKRNNAIGLLTVRLLQREREMKYKVVRILKNRVENKTFQVDYENKKFYEVCKDFIDFTIKSSNSLDMLCRPWAPDKEDLPQEDIDLDPLELPSWICPLSRSPFRPRPDGNFGRVNADLLVGMPDTRVRTYNASATTRPENCQFIGRSLNVHGFILDDIKEVRTEAVEGNIPHDWLQLGEWEKTTDDPPESFWRTLVADRDENGRNPPSYYQRACQYAFTQRVIRGSLNTGNLISSDTSKIMTKYLKRVQAVVWMRKLIKTQRGNRLGLVPHRAQAGDKICILRGCSVPVVLRYAGDGDFNTVMSRQTIQDQGASDFNGDNASRRSTVVETLNGTTPSPNPAFKFEKSLPFKLIGECYVHGVMDGEAFKIRDKHEIKEMEFELQ